MIYPVILAGGKGERFWPYSHSQRPKQLLPLVTKKTMLEDTLANIRHLQKNALVHMVISQNLEKPIKAMFKKDKRVRIITEPQGKNTAAAIALACRLIQKEDPQGVMLVLTADHAITPPAKFKQAMQAAADVAAEGKSLVTFGIKPDRAEVGFGYVETQGQVIKQGGLSTFKVKQFHEKPDAKRAEAYLHSGKHFWNSGMFAWRVDYLWQQFQQHLPETAKPFDKEKSLVSSSASFKNKLKAIYKQLPEVSIDYGLMEKAQDIRVIIPEFKWDDIGSWLSLDRLHKADTEGNRAIGQTVFQSTKDCTFFSDSGMVAAFGVENLLIVQHRGVTLVVDKRYCPNLKELVKKVQKEKKLQKFV